MTNSILLYTGNVTSSPIVKYLGTHKKVWVPVFEHFDLHRLKETLPKCNNYEKLISQLFKAIFSRQHSSNFEHWCAKTNLNYKNGFPSNSDIPHTFFKWRPFVDSQSAYNYCFDVLAEFNVKPMFVFRRSLREQALKIHLSESVYGSRHQQFIAGQMSESEYHRYLLDQTKITVSLASDDLLAIRNIARGFMHRTEQLIHVSSLIFGSQKVNTLISEEIFVDSGGFERLSKTFSELFDDRIYISGNEKISVRKAGMNIENCCNNNIVFDDPELSELENSYHELILKSNL